jgi:DUF917 family protein
MVRSALAIGASGVVLVLGGCGGGDTPATVQQQLASEYSKQLSKISGLTADKSCIEKEIATLSDTDAQTVLDKLQSGQKLSAQFKSFNDAISACLSTG